MEQPTAIAALDFFTASRAGIDLASDQLIEAVRAGEVKSLKLRVWAKMMEQIIERVLKETISNQLTEADKYPSGKIEEFGAIIERAELGTKYDYSGCGDTTWERLHADFETAKSRLSEREAFLKAMKSPMTIIDEMTGEVVAISPPVKTSTSGLKVTIK